MSNEERIEHCQNFISMLDKFMGDEISESEFDKAFEDFMSDCDNYLIFD